MATPERQELIRNAISFLNDPKSSSSPLAQKLQFLEAKGLTPGEIDIALRQSASPNAPSNQQYASGYPQPYGMLPPPHQRWDWRDYFIGAVVSGTVVYGAVSLFKKYLQPHLQPPTSTAYEQDRDALTAQFDAAEALLKEIQAETAAVRAAVADQKEKVDKATDNVNAAVTEMREGETKTRDEIREIRDEVNNIREMLPKMIEKNKESQTQSLGELQQELKSLKALLLSRGPSVPAAPSPPINFGRPSIPAWQLASAPQPASSSVPNVATTTSTIAPEASSTASAKGKEVVRHCAKPNGKLMFSQLKSAVEQLAQQVPPIPGVTEEHIIRRGSSDQGARPISSGQLADNALLSLRRSLSTQRDSSPAPPIRRTMSGTTPVRKSNLEERLRKAALATGDASSSSSTAQSKVDSRSGSPAPKNDLPNPASVPLPPSPDVQPLESSSSVDAVSKVELATETQPATESNESPLPESEGTTAPKAPITEATASPPSATEQAGIITVAASDLPTDVPPEISGSDASQRDTEGKENNSNQSSSPPSPPVEQAPVPSETNDDSTNPSETSPSPALSESTAPAVPTESGTTSSQENDSIVSSPDTVSQSPSDASPSTSPSIANDGDSSHSGPSIDELQTRLKQVERRFSDVSSSFKRLQAEKQAADLILREHTPLETIQDAEGLADYFKNVQSKISVFQGEVKRLNEKLEDYEEQLSDLRAVHVSETSSNAEQIDKLRVQLKETEALFQASERAASKVEDTLSQHKATTDALNAQIAALRTQVSQEEEKRVKAISLLKTVRQKLVKTERDRDEVLQTAKATETADKEERERDRLEKERLKRELEHLEIEKEKTALAQRAQYERELAIAKERHDRELAAVKGQLELEIITLKASHSKDIATKTAQIATLENTVNNVTRDKNNFFEQLQIKQAETESAQGHLESLQLQNTEFEFQLREANDRLALLREEYTEYQREQEDHAREPTTSADDVAQMIAATESRYEVKIAEMKRNLELLERERSESEGNWSRKMKEKVREVEELSKALGTTAKSREEDISVADNLRSDLAVLKEEIRLLREEVAEVPILQERIQESKQNAKDQEQEAQLKIQFVENQLEEYKARESQLRQANKTLREELRKVQSSAALLERQRNPGVGYWNRAGAQDGASSPSAEPSTPRTSSPAPSVSSTSHEEEVNLEYLRNVLLQFLEHKEMRPNLVKVISIIMRFTPQETRRLMAKV